MPVSVEAIALQHIQPDLTDVQHVHTVLFRVQPALCVHVANMLSAKLACRYKMSSNIIPPQSVHHLYSTAGKRQQLQAPKGQGPKSLSQ